MKVIILAAGYAKRLYPRTLDNPKPLLPIAGKPMIEYVLDHLPAHAVESIYVVSNSKFVSKFQDWLDSYRRTTKANITLIDNGSVEDADDHGAIGSLRAALTDMQGSDDIIVVAADNLFSESLEEFGRFCSAKDTPVIGVYTIKNIEEAKHYGSVITNSDGRVTFFEEKPEQPNSDKISVALYYYPSSSISLIYKYIEEGNNPDSLGSLVEWLYLKVPIYSWPVPGIWYDIGSKESLEAADQIFTKAYGRKA